VNPDFLIVFYLAGMASISDMVWDFLKWNRKRRVMNHYWATVWDDPHANIPT